MKRVSWALALGITLASFYAFAAYRPTLSPLQNRIIRIITETGEQLADGIKIITTGKQAQDRINEQRQEREIAAKKALERQKSLSGKHGSQGRYGGGGHGRPHHGGGYNPWGGGHSGGGYRPGGSGYAPYGGNGQHHYDDDYDYDHYGSKPTTPATPPTSTTDTNTGGVDVRAQQEAAKLAQEREKNAKELLAAAEKIAATMGNSTPKDTGYDDKLDGLSDEFETLQQAGSTHNNNMKKDSGAEPKKDASGKTAKTKETSTALDRQITGAYRNILRHTLYAATRDNNQITTAANALRTDMNRALGKKEIEDAAKTRANTLLAEWKKDANRGGDFDAEIEIFKGSNQAIIKNPKPAALTLAAGTKPGRAYNTLPAGYAPTGFAITLPTGMSAAANGKDAYTNYFNARLTELKALEGRFIPCKINKTKLGNLHDAIKTCEENIAELSK